MDQPEMTPSSTDNERLLRDAKAPGFFADIWGFLKTSKKWWLLPPLLMPAAHALVHAEEDATRALEGLTADEIWMKRSSAASIGRIPCSR